MSALENLGRQVAAEQDALLADRDELERVKQRLSGAEGRPPRVRRGWRSVSLLAAATLVVLALLLFKTRPEPLAFTVGEARTAGEVGQWLSANGPRPLPIEFSDGTRLSLGPSARARIASLSAAGADIVVESGRAELSVAPLEGATWRVTLGPFAVHVTGTRFSVDWNPEAQLLVLALDEGRVLVSGCVFGDGRSVVAGETVRADCSARRIEITSRGGEPSSAPSSGASAAPRLESGSRSPVPPPAAAVSKDSAKHADVAAPAAGTSVAVAGVAAWRKLASSGDYRAAFAAAEAEGFDALCNSASAADLLVLGDVARFSGQLAKADLAYQGLRRRFPGDSRAAVAAFALARIAFDQQGAYAVAARWFETYLREQPAGPLAREALGRLIEARQRSGNRAGALEAAESYLTRHPGGPHTELAQRLTRD